ncbi:hypothetical protein D6783_01820 [Candidatus Woesearchaeota archaeon]|nr:MAG: hypothetical protein D6783_01820 [Candidatus Woesearchaeota archaeon]
MNSTDDKNKDNRQGNFAAHLPLFTPLYLHIAAALIIAAIILAATFLAPTAQSSNGELELHITPKTVLVGQNITINLVPAVQRAPANTTTAMPAATGTIDTTNLLIEVQTPTTLLRFRPDSNQATLPLTFIPTNPGKHTFYLLNAQTRETLATKTITASSANNTDPTNNKTPRKTPRKAPLNQTQQEQQSNNNTHLPTPSNQTNNQTHHNQPETNHSTTHQPNAPTAEQKTTTPPPRQSAADGEPTLLLVSNGVPKQNTPTNKQQGEQRARVETEPPTLFIRPATPLAQREQTNIPARTNMQTREHARGAERSTETFVTTTPKNLTALKGVYDISIPRPLSRTQRITLNGVILPQRILLGAEDLTKKPRIKGRSALHAFAIDPTHINFTNGTIEQNATGTQLWKCTEWNFTAQTCSGTWRYVKDITPGMPYTISFNATDPAFAETNLTIINVQSYPTVGGNWTVRFTTIGDATLTIEASNGTTWVQHQPGQLDPVGIDLSFLQVTCGDTIRNYTWSNGKVIIPHYSCNETGKEVSTVKTRGVHVLRFTFGNDVQYAKNYASATGILQLRDAAGGQSTADQTSGTDITWDTQDRIDPAFNHTLGTSTITINTPGVYRVSYGVAVRQAGSGRIEDNARIYVNGTLQPQCWGSTYTRGSTSVQDGVITSDCLVELGTGSTLKLNVLRTSSTTTAESTVGNRTWLHLQLVKDADVFLAHDAGGGQDMDQVAGTILTWDTQDRADSPFQFTPDANNVTVTQPGLYRITYGIATEHATTTRYAAYGAVLINDTLAPVGYSHVNLRGTDSTQNGVVTADALVELGAGATIKIRGGRASASSVNAVTTPDRSWLHIERIPDQDQKVVMVRESAGGQSLDTTVGTDITWDTTQREDAFFNKTSASTIRIEKSGLYRVAYNVYNNRQLGDPGVTQRIEIGGNLRVNGADQTVCWSQGYNRGDQGTPDSFEGANFASCLLNLSAGDNITVYLRRTSSASAALRTTGNRTWWYIQALDAINTPPTTTLNTPLNDTLLNTATVDFNFTPTDNDTTSFTCTLYGNFSGAWGPNETTTATNNTETNITTTLNDGTYQWNIVCQDLDGATDWGDQNRTLTIDTKPPTISSVNATSITDTTAFITWTTDEPANSTVHYGTTTSLGNTTTDSALVTAHGVPLSGLQPNTLYYYNVTSCDAAGNCNTSGTYNFTTTSEPDTTPPTITNVNATPEETTADVTWTTDEPANSTVHYGTTPSLGNTSSSTSFVTDHVITLTGLTPLVLYYYNVTSCDAAGNCNTSGTYNFTTVDFSPPSVTLHTPPDASTTNLTPGLTFSAMDNVAGVLPSCSLYHNATGNFTLNTTLYNITQGQNYTFNNSFLPGTYTWNVLCEDNQNNTGFTAQNKTFTAQDQDIIVTLLTPPDDYVSSSLTVTYNCSATDDYGLTNISLYLNTSGSWEENQTTSVSGTQATASFTVDMPVGFFTWNCKATDTFGNSFFSSSNRTLYADNRSLILTQELSDTVVKPGTRITINGSLFMSDNQNIGNNELAITLNESPLNPTDENETTLGLRNIIPAWWRVTYKYRTPINITNNDASNPLQEGTTVNVTVNTQSLTAAGKLLANGSDLRVVYWNGSENIELDRINTTPFNTTATVILFRLQANISPSASDSNYSLYYGNPNAGAPPSTPHRVYLPLETKRIINATGTWQDVTLNATYHNPVIVAQVEEVAAPTQEVSVRIANVTSNSFQLKLQNPGDRVFSPRNVSVFIIEAGRLETMDGTTLLEAHRFQESQVLGSSTSTPTTYDTLSFFHTYPSAPAVIGQVMSYQDPLWVDNHINAPGTTSVQVALEMGQYCDQGASFCPNAEGHEPEELGIIVWERTTGNLSGTPFEAAGTSDTILGIDNAPSCWFFTFTQAFTHTPLAVADLDRRDGIDGGWSPTCGISTASIGLHVEEEDESDGERGHTTESATYLAIGGEGTFTVKRYVATPPSTTSGSEEQRPAKTNEQGTYTYNYTTPLAEGTYNITTAATYLFFSAANTSFLIVDNTSPFVNITSITPNPSELGIENVEVNWTATDPTLAEAYLNVTYPNGTLLGTYTTNSTLFTPANLTVKGIYTLTLFAKDGADNTNTTQAFLTVQDTTPPSITLLEPDNDTWVLTSTPTFIYYPSDHDALQNCTLYGNFTGAWGPNETDTSPTNNANNTFTTTIADGAYEWNVQCIDAEGNAGFATTNFTFRLDTTPPAVQLKSPLNNTKENTTNNIVFTYNTTDVMTGVASCILIIDGAQSGPADTTITEGINQTFNAFVANGQHNWSVNCTDQNGFVGSSPTYNLTVEVLSESDPPLVTLYYPPSPAYFSVDTVLFNYTPDDATGIANCSIFLDGQLNQTDTNVTNHAMNNFTITAIAEGDHQWNITCYDNLTNAKGDSETRNLTIDLTNPSIALNTPLNDTFITTSTVVFNYTPQDTNLANCTLYADFTGAWGPNETDTAPTNAAPNTFTKMLQDGPYLWNVLCMDRSRRSGFAPANYTAKVDTAPPIFGAQATNPATPATYSPSQQYTFNITINEPFVDTVLFEHNFTGTFQNETVTTHTGSEYTFTHGPIAAGTYAYRWHANDSLGRSNTTPWNNYTVNKATTAISLLFNGTEDDISIVEDQTVNITALLQTPSTGELELYQDGALINNGTAPLTNITTYALPGTYNITALYRETQNYTSATVTHFITVNDTRAPTITLLFPDENATVGKATVTFRYNVSDQGTIQNCSIYINGTLNQTDTTVQPGSLQTFTITFADGSYNWRVDCYDTASNYATSETRNFSVLDSTLINLTVTTPTQAYEQGQTIPITINTTDRFSNPLATNASTAIIYTNTTTTTIPWWNENFTYRKRITITNNEASELTRGYTVNLTLDTTGPKMQDNGTDVRIVYYNQTNHSLTELDRINTTPFNTTTTTLRFKLQASINASGSDSNYFLYYGNPNAGTPPEDPSNVYLFYDDFEDGDINGWQDHTTPGLRFALDSGNGVLLKTTNSDPGGGYATLPANITNYETTFLSKRINENGGSANRYGILTDTGNGYGPRYESYGTATPLYIEERTGFSATTVASSTSITLPSNTWHHWTFRKIGQSMNFTIRETNGTLIQSVSGSDPTFANTNFTRFQIMGGYEYYTDNIMVRFLVANEPSTTLAAEQELYQHNRTQTDGITGLSAISFGTNLSLPQGNYSIVTLAYRPDFNNADDATYITLGPDQTPPNTTLQAPANDSFVGNTTVTFTYTPSELNVLDTCTLYGNFTGTWSPNETDTSPTNNANNTFTITIADGTYLWNVQCNDSLGNAAFSPANYTVNVDTTPPTIQLNEPANNSNQSSPVTFNWTVSDNLATNLTCVLLINGTQNGSQEPAQEGIPTTTTRNLTTSGTTSWQINCTDEANNTGSSQPYQFFHLTPPTNITIDYINAAATLNWTPPPGAVTYNVYITNNYSQGRPPNPNASNIPDTNYTDQNASQIQQRYYWVSAVRGTAEAIAPVPVGKYTVSLTGNLSLLSFPLTPSTTRLRNATEGLILRTTPDCVLSLWRYTSSGYERTDWNGTEFVPAAGSENFTVIDTNTSYWLEKNTSCNITFVGTVPTQNETIALYSGITFAGWHTILNQTLPTNYQDPLFTTTPANALQAIDRYNSDTNTFEVTIHYDVGSTPWGWWPSANNPDFTTMDPARGYVLDAVKNATWTFDPKT